MAKCSELPTRLAEVPQEEVSLRLPLHRDVEHVPGDVQADPGRRGAGGHDANDAAGSVRRQPGNARGRLDGKGALRCEEECAARHVCPRSVRMSPESPDPQPKSSRSCGDHKWGTTTERGQLSVLGSLEAGDPDAAALLCAIKISADGQPEVMGRAEHSKSGRRLPQQAGTFRRAGPRASAAECSAAAMCILQAPQRALPNREAGRKASRAFGPSSGRARSSTARRVSLSCTKKTEAQQHVNVQSSLWRARAHTARGAPRAGQWSHGGDWLRAASPRRQPHYSA